MEKALAYSSAKYLEVDGVVKRQQEWCKELGINASTVSVRLKRGLSPKEALGLA